MILITPPTSPVVPLAELKLHLRVDYADEDQLIAQLEAAAVGYLDGWRGVLGRAILPQVWRQEFAAWGTLQLALPDVSSVTVTYLDGSNVEQPAAVATLRPTCSGYEVEASGPSTSRIFVNMNCAMQASQLSTVKAAIKMIVGHWFQNREAAVAGNMSDVPMSANALLSALRWNRI